MVTVIAGRDATVAELADDLEISEVAIRRHVQRLVDEGWVAGRRDDPTGPGRPVTRYHLTDRGHALLPQDYAALASELLEWLQLSAGPQGVADFLGWRARRQADDLAARVDADRLDDRLAQLAAALTDAGAPATVVEGDDGYVLRQHHCTVMDVARAHPQVCHAEAAEFSRVLGDDVRIRRGASRAAGDATCECAVVVVDVDDDRVLPLVHDQADTP
ncbi:transcriptional regulator [Nitriliruptoria bacterium AS10]|nr:transcriptional regulator [Salsipaludibacter albus]MBY5164336.1 transcriptional regulator [Salsipaludibacter albus]